jgi:putative transposase
MTTKLYPTELSNRQWELIKELLPAPAVRGRKRQLDLRQVLNAILYVVVGGIQWRLLPHHYPKWKSVYHYFRQWRKDGTWQRLHDTLRARLRQKLGRHKHPTAGCLDSQSVKTTCIGGTRGYDKGKNVNGRKRHLLVDTLGLLLGVVVTAASTSDPAGARLLFGRWGGRGGHCKRLSLIWVDGTYRGTLLEWAKGCIKALLQPVLRRDDQQGFVVLPKRWIVERTFAWLGHSRRLSKDYEFLPQTSEAMICIAMTRIMLNRMCKE